MTLDAAESQAVYLHRGLGPAAMIGKLRCPQIEVDFRGTTSTMGLVATTYAPHLVWDALLMAAQDVKADAASRRLAERLVCSTEAQATALLEHCPSVLLFCGVPGRHGVLERPVLRAELAGWSERAPNRRTVVRRARHVALLSLPLLRTLRFPEESSRQTVVRPGRDRAARTLLCALAVGAISAQGTFGFATRGRHDLLPQLRLIQIESESGAVLERFRVPRLDAAAELFESSVDELRACGFRWSTEPVHIRPTEDLIQAMVRASASGVRILD